jgi:hypothetical protein
MTIPRTPIRHRSRAVNLTVVPLLAAAFVAGCASDESEESAYCVDAQDRVVDDERCDDGGSAGYFVYFGGRALVGSRIGRGTTLTNGDRVASTDHAAVASRGGFGGSARPGGVGRTVTASDGGRGAGS